MRTYVFKIVLERDEDFDGTPEGWRAFSPEMEQQGASAWGATQEEALQHLREVLQITVESMIEHGEPLPVEPIGAEDRLESELVVSL